MRSLNGEVPKANTFGPKITKQSSEVSETRFENVVIQDVSMFGGPTSEPMTVD